MEGVGEEEVLPLLLGWVHGVKGGLRIGVREVSFFPARGEVGQVVLAAIIVASVWI